MTQYLLNGWKYRYEVGALLSRRQAFYVKFISYRDMVKGWDEEEDVSDTSRCVVLYQKNLISCVN
jgi:hypothetical protein